MKLSEIAGLLAGNIDKLPACDHDFARSLLQAHASAQLGGWPLSEKRKEWIVKLARKATGREAPAQQAQADSFKAVVSFLHAASQHLQKPSLRFVAGGETLRLSIAGPRSSEPGAIDVRHATRGEVDPATGFTRKDWYGRIGLDGAYRGTSKFDQGPVREALRVIAIDPAGAAKLFGQITGACCFCGQELTDGASIAVGYGPICAEHWGLPHGEDHGVKGGFREQKGVAEEIAQEPAPKPETPIVPCKGPVTYQAPKKLQAASQEPLNDRVDDLWVDRFVA